MPIRLTCAIVVAALLGITHPAPTDAAEAFCPAILDHKFANLMDEPVSLCQHRGKVVLVVNTASECGYTPQYDGLEKLYRRYRDRGFVVLGFPANDFGGQEPGDAKKIAETCFNFYGVQFPMFNKISVVGAGAHPLYAALAKATGQAPQWNFHKYLVDRQGRVVASFASEVAPLDKKVIGQLESTLAQR